MTVPLFGVNLGGLDGPAAAGPDGTTSAGTADAVPWGLAAAARWAEDQGLDVVTAADHLGHASPFVALAARRR